MNQAFNETACLLVRDVQGDYLPASPERILEAARQVVDQKMQRGASLVSPTAVKEYLTVKLAGFEHEVFAVLCLDSKHRLIHYLEMFRGTLDCAAVHPREVVKEALRCNAAGLILAHNHPSGNSEPSSADRQITQRIKDALDLVSVRILDHIVVGGRQVSSFAEHGYL